MMNTTTTTTQRLFNSFLASFTTIALSAGIAAAQPSPQQITSGAHGAAWIELTGNGSHYVHNPAQLRVSSQQPTEVQAQMVQAKIQAPATQPEPLISTAPKPGENRFDAWRLNSYYHSR